MALANNANSLDFDRIRSKVARSLGGSAGMYCVVAALQPAHVWGSFPLALSVTHRTSSQSRSGLLKLPGRPPIAFLRTGRSLPNISGLTRERAHSHLRGTPALSDPAKIRQDSQHPSVVLRFGSQVELKEDASNVGLHGALP